MATAAVIVELSFDQVAHRPIGLVAFDARQTAGVVIEIVMALQAVLRDVIFVGKVHGQNRRVRDHVVA